MKNNDIQWTKENRELNDRVREIVENERNSDDVHLRPRLRQQILASEERTDW